jgi:hypothetical protein
MFNKPVTALLGLLALCLTMALASKSAEQLQIGVKYKPDECPLKTRNGDRLSMQYVVISAIEFTISRVLPADDQLHWYPSQGWKQV